MLNKILLTIVAICISAIPAICAQQHPVSSTTLPTNFTHGDYRSLIDDNFSKLDQNFTELYGLPSYGILQSDIDNWNAKQNRVSGTCSGSEAIQIINADGSVHCVAGGGGSGDVTAAANLADLHIVIGDGGAKGVKTGQTTEDASGNVTVNGNITVTGQYFGQTSADGPQFTLFREDSDNGTNYVGIGSQASNDNDLVFLLPAGDPTAGQVISWGVPSPITFSDGTARDATVGTFVNQGGGSSLYVSTPPTYSDEACTPGQYAFDTGYIYDCVSSGDWNRIATTDWSNPAPATYTLNLTVTDSDGSGGTIAIGGTNYTAGTYAITGQSGTVNMTATYGTGQDTLTWTGDTVDGSYQNYSIDMGNADKTITGTFTQSGSASYELEENFNGTGYQQTGWVETDNPDEDYSTDPAPLEGDQSIYIVETSTNSGTDHAVTASQTKSVRYLFNPQATNNDANIFTFKRSNSNSLCTVVFESSTGAVRVRNRGNTISSDTVDTMADGTTYVLWVDYASADKCSVAFAPVSGGHATKPTSGNAYTEVAVTDTDDVTTVSLLSSHANMAYIADDFKADSASIGDL